jgi:hypothetical protein
MTRSEFLRALKVQTSDAAIFGTKANLQRPPGRKPRKEDVKLSDWYRNLTESDRVLVDASMKEAAELAVFSFLCVLDGVSAIEDGPDKGDLKLQYFKHGEELLLNDPQVEFLHDGYNRLCQESSPTPPQQLEGRAYEVGGQSQLRERQTSGDALDMHSLPSTSTEPPATAPAIALPKNEHRKI